MKVIVLGSGIIGITTAYYLASNGHQVTVLDKNSKPAMGCSYANGGQLSYSHINTWSKDINFKIFFQSIINKKSFISIKKFDKKTISWLYKFYQNSNDKSSYQNSLMLFYLASYSKDLMQLFLNHDSVHKIDQSKINYSSRGILHFYRNKKIFDLHIRNLKKLDFLKNNYKILTPQQCIEYETNLSKLYSQKKLAGGILYQDDSSADSYEFANQLKKICEEKLNVTFKYNIEIKNILNNHKKITGINTSEDVYVADNYVYALGFQGDNLLDGIGINTNILPVRGYSLSIDTDQNNLSPVNSLTDVENKIVFSRLGNKFRVAGIAEFSSGDEKQINKKNYEYLESIARESLTNIGDTDNIEKWSGVRPFRYNSIPLICKVKKYPNLFLNTGHGSLGWTLSLASGKILSDLIDHHVHQQFEFLDNQNLEF